MIRASARRIATVTAHQPHSHKLKEFHGLISVRHQIKPVLAVPPLTHRVFRADTKRGGKSLRFFLSRRDYSPRISFNFPWRKTESAGTEFIKNSAITQQSLFSGNNALWRLLGALWSIYRSNNLQLSQSFLSLLHSASERRISLSAWVSSSRVLQALARSQITQTQKLGGVLIYESRTQRHTFNKIDSELSRQLLILRDRMPPHVFNNFQNFTKVFGGNLFPMRRIFTPVRAELRAQEKPGTIFKIKHTDFHTESRILDRLSLLSRYTGRDWETKSLRSALFTRAWIVPVLYRLYEELEANTMFYSASSYQSTRTLYRLTNSLWKVYNNQNLELSRSFTRLINMVTEKNTELKIMKHHSGMFSTTRSLGNLVNALRNAFSGNNLSLRNSLVSLISDINEAGASHRNHHYKSINNTLNFHRIEAPKVAGRRAFILHKASGISKNDTHSDMLTRDVERLLEEKLKNLSAASPVQSKDMDALYRHFADRFGREQRQDWRYEKLRRGLL